jgi:hypothetical protein
MILLLIIILIFTSIIYEDFNDHGREIIQALDHEYNDNINCDFHSPNDSDIAFPVSNLLEDEIAHCSTYGSYKM